MFVRTSLRAYPVEMLDHFETYKRYRINSLAKLEGTPALDATQEPTVGNIHSLTLYAYCLTLTYTMCHLWYSLLVGGVRHGFLDLTHGNAVIKKNNNKNSCKLIIT